MLFHRSTKKTNSHENLISLTLASGSSSKSSTPQSSKSSTAAAAAAEQQDKDKDKDNDVIENWYISKSKAKSKSTNNNIICCNMMPTFLSTITSYMNSTRLMVLIVLCLQNSLFTVLRRYSQGVLKEDYSKHELLLVAELIKIAYSAWMISKNLKSANNDTAASSSVLSSSTSSSSSSIDVEGSLSLQQQQQQTSPSKQQHHPHHKSISLSNQLLYLISTSKKMFVLALIYGAMNILSFISLRNISAGTFTIFAQCKILTTATFSTLILKRSYSWTKWRSLLTLMLGVLLFSEPIWGGIFSSSNNDSDSSTNSTGTGNALLGTAAVLIEVTLSGFASIYFEKVIKTDPLQLGIWERNFQLALSSVPVYLLFIIGNGGGTAGGFFTGWSILAFGLSVLGAAGGLLVALSIKYGDSILKTLATTGAIVLTGVLDHLFLGGPLTPSMIIAGLQVIISICNYTFDATVDVSAVATEAVAATNNSPSTLKSSLTPGGGGGGDDDDENDETELLLLRRSPMKRAEP